MNYNDYGHLRQDPKDAALGYQIGPKSVITFPSGGQQLPGRGFYEISGLAWSGGGAIRKVEVSTDGGKNWKDAEIRGNGPSHGAHPIQPTTWNWDGTETEHPVALHGRTRSGATDASPGRQVLQRAAGSRHSACRATDNTIQPWRIARDGSVHNGALLKASRVRVAPGERRAGAVAASIGVGRTPTRRGNPCLGYLHQSDRRRNSRRGAEPPRKARRSIARRDARDATARDGTGGRLPF